MKGFLFALLLLPFVLLFVFTNQLQTYQSTAAVPTAPQPTSGVVTIPLPTPVPFIGPPSNIVEAAMQWLGVRYLWGGCTRQGVDCSCFVRNVLAVFGINAPRTTVQQIAWATPVSREQLAVGDIVFFNNTCRDCGPNPTHEGLYIGGGMMIHAGDPVQIAPVFGSMQYAGAGRPRP